MFESQAEAEKSSTATIQAWVEYSLPRGLAYASSLLRDSHAAEDVVHDCFCRLLAKRDVYDLPKDGCKILLRSITNACIDLGRKDTPVSNSLDLPEDHSEPIERCYWVTVEREFEDRLEFKPPRDVRLWTQGDRFWVEVDRGERRWAWGRNPDGAVWTTLGPRRAVQIEPDELGRPLKYMTDLYALELESLLQTILHRYRLERTSSTTTTHVITARPRGQRERWIREAVIEVDKETKAVRRLVLQRQLPERGASLLTFTLVDARTPDESKYHPEGHLIEPFRIVASDVSVERRRELLVARFGPAAGRWIQSKPPTPDLQ